MAKKKRIEGAPKAIGAALYVHIQGMGFAPPVEGHLSNKSELPFACARCFHQLIVMQGHTLAPKSTTPVMCIGTCLDAIKGDQEAIAELNLTEAERDRLGNAFRIPDEDVAQAMGLNLAEVHAQAQAKLQAEAAAAAARAEKKAQAAAKKKGVKPEETPAEEGQNAA